MTFAKVCGITNPEDARAAAEARADAIGLLFAESSRRVSAEQAQEIVEALSDHLLKVGVFVNEKPEEILRITGEVGLDMAQLHGDETPEDVTYLRERGLKVMKALRVRDASSLAEMEEYGADLYLLDAWSKKARGGTGTSFDWDVAISLIGRDNIVVSGGLTPENVREAIAFFDPYGVDASSSLESAPGKKNRERVRRFVCAAKG